MQGHVAYPQLARNPIHLAAPALAELAATRWDEGNVYFPPTTWQCSNIHAGTGATNVIPGALEVMFNFRFCPDSSRESLVRAARRDPRAARARLRSRLDRIRPTVSDRTRQARRRRHGGRARGNGIAPELSCTGGTSDGRFIAGICDEIVELGPVNASIHQVNERVRIADLGPLAAIYLGILERLLT